MRRATCPACNTALTLRSMLAAPTPLHLSCSACKTRLRVRGPIGPVALALAIGLGVYFGARIISHGMSQAMPMLGTLAVLELVVAVFVIAFGKLEARR